MLSRFISLQQRVPVTRLAGAVSIRRSSTVDTPLSQPAQTDLRDKEEGPLDRVNCQREADPLSLDKLSSAHSTATESLSDVRAKIAKVPNQNRQAQLKALINELAQTHYSENTCRVDWERVSEKSGLPVLKCLDLFSFEDAGIKRRELTHAKSWKDRDVSDMELFISRHYENGDSIQWACVSKYINASEENCRVETRRTRSHKWTDEELVQIEKYIIRDLTWTEIKEKMGIPGTVRAYKSAHAQYLNTQVRFVKRGFAFTGKDRKRLNRIFEKYPMYSHKDPRFISIVEEAFPSKGRESIDRAISSAYTAYSSVMFKKSLCREIIRLVKEHGEDWIKIGHMVDKHPISVECNWNKCKDDPRHFQKMSVMDEIQALTTHPNDNLYLNDKSSLVHESLLKHHHSHMELSREASIDPRSMSRPKNIMWTQDMDNRLIYMAEMQSKKRGSINWFLISTEFGCSKEAAQTRYNTIKSSSHDIQPDTSMMITSAVKRELSESDSIDWKTVSIKLGYPIRTCLELNQCDEGKRPWTYDPDSYSKGFELEVRKFVERNFTSPNRIDYRVLSNHFWIKPDDVKKMVDLMLDINMKTSENIAKVKELKEQGMSFDDIARHIGPHMTSLTIYSWINEAPVKKRRPQNNELSLISKMVKNMVRDGKSRDEIEQKVLDAFPQVEDRLVHKAVCFVHNICMTKPQSYLLDIKGDLYRQVYEENKSLDELAAKYNTSTIVIRNCIKKYKKERRRDRIN